MSGSSPQMVWEALPPRVTRVVGSVTSPSSCSSPSSVTHARARARTHTHTRVRDLPHVVSLRHMRTHTHTHTHTHVRDLPHVLLAPVSSFLGPGTGAPWDSWQCTKAVHCGLAWESAIDHKCSMELQLVPDLGWFNSGFFSFTMV